MLTRIAATSHPDDPASNAYQCLHSKSIVELDISARETCHMLQKLSLVTCNHTFTKLNVVCQIFCRVSHDLSNYLSSSNFTDTYLIHLVLLEPICMIDLRKHWTYNQAWKNEKWKKRQIPTIFHVWPLFTTIPNKESNTVVEFCWSELLLYKPFRSFSKDIGISK
jgi:hypothetical protein